MCLCSAILDLKMSKKNNSTLSSDVVEQNSLKISRKFKGLLFFGLALLIVIIVLIVHSVHSNTVKNQNAFQINHKNYPKDLVADMVTYSLEGQAKVTQADKSRAARNIYNLYKTEIAAQQVGVVPNSGEMQAAEQQIDLPRATTSADKDYAQVAAFNVALNQAYSRYSSADDQGYIFVFDFSQKIIPPAVQEKPVAGYGNQQLINQDKQYADQQAQQYYAQFKNHQISATDLLSAIAANPRISFGSVSTYIDASKGSIRSQILYSDIYNYVAAQKGPLLSSVRVGKVATKQEPGPNNYADGYYYFVQLSKASPLIDNPEGTVGTQTNKLQAVYYGI